MGPAGVRAETDEVAPVEADPEDVVGGRAPLGLEIGGRENRQPDEWRPLAPAWND
jgi:hypothetical protein